MVVEVVIQNGAIITGLITEGQGVEITGSGTLTDPYVVNATGDGSQGPPGKSAYEVAVDNGFVGTEPQWLASLKGDPGADGEDGEAGADGKSAYQIWLDEGNTGSEQDFLDSLVGPAGTTDYNELSNKPSLGTAAAANTEDFATTAQGAKADTAVQPAAIAAMVESKQEEGKGWPIKNYLPITQDDYDSLAVKDPHTEYAIIDQYPTI